MANEIESLRSRLAEAEAERALIIQRAENAEAALVEANETITDIPTLCRRYEARLAEAEAACRLLVQWDDAENNAKPFADDNGAAFYSRVALCRQAMDAARAVVANTVSAPDVTCATHGCTYRDGKCIRCWGRDAHSKAIDSLLDDCATVYGGPFPEGTK
jgi:hypothetical protein